MKGKSTRVVMVAEAMKSRIDSNERRLAANEPTDTGRPSIRRSSTRSMICADSRTSTRLLALSTTCERAVLRIMLKITTRVMPSASTQSVSTALLGTTRSYTFMVNNGIAMAKMLISRAAMRASRYRRRFSMMAAQNQWRSRTLATSGARASKRNCGRTKQTRPVYCASSSAALISTALPPSSGWLITYLSPSFLSNRQARSPLSSRIAGNRSDGSPSSGRLTTRADSCARAAARGSSAGVSRCASSGRPADSAWAVAVTPCNRVISTRQSSNGSSCAARASARHSRAGASDNLSIIVIQQVQMLRESRALLLALGEFLLGLYWQVRHAQGAIGDQGVDQVFQHADEVRIQP